MVAAVATWCEKPSAHHTQELSKRRTIYSGHNSVCLPTAAPNGVGTNCSLCENESVWDSKKEGDRKQGKRGRTSKKGVVNPVTHTANTQTSPQTMALVLSYYRQPWLNRTAPQATHETAAPHYFIQGEGPFSRRTEEEEWQYDLKQDWCRSKMDLWVRQSQQTKYQKLFLLWW